MTLAERLEELRKSRIEVTVSVRKSKNDYPDSAAIAARQGLVLVNERLLTDLITAAREVTE